MIESATLQIFAIQANTVAVVKTFKASTSSLATADANNETTHYLTFENGRWYSIRLRVLPDKIQAWVDDEKVVDVVTTDRRLSIRFEVEPSLPLGVATWSTAAALRNFTIRRL